MPQCHTMLLAHSGFHQNTRAPLRREKYSRLKASASKCGVSTERDPSHSNAHLVAGVSPLLQQSCTQLDSLLMGSGLLRIGNRSGISAGRQDRCDLAFRCTPSLVIPSASFCVYTDNSELRQLCNTTSMYFYLTGTYSNTILTARTPRQPKCQSCGCILIATTTL
jgi:hypothetical protein